MNLKDTGFLQKNVEKLVLGLSVLFLLVTAWWFLMGNPFPIEVSRRAIGPGEIEQQIDSVARGLEARLDSNDTALPDRPLPSYSEAFIADMAQKPTTMPKLAPLAHAGLDPDVVPEVGELPIYDLPRPPVAEGILARKGHAVLSDNIRTRDMEGLIKLIGNHDPKDFAYVSVAATFDMDEWIERLQSGDKDTRIPSRWWNSMIGVAGVMLQRQELDEATGEWGNEVLIGPLPDQLAFKPSVALKAETTQQVKQMIQLIRSSQEKVARPDFPMTRGPILWSPPNEDAQELDADGQRKLSRINSNITNIKDQIERLQETLAKARDVPERAVPDRSARGRRAATPRGGNAGGYGGEMGGGDGGRASRRPAGGARGGARGGVREAEAPTTPQDRLNLYQQQLIEAKIERDELLGIESDVLSREGHRGAPGGYGGEMGGYGGEMGGYGGEMGGYGGGAGAGYDPYGGGGGYGGGGYGAPGGYAPEGIAGLAQQDDPETRKIKVWAHDLSIEPGKTYRYRVVVAVLNPLFRQKRISEEQREEHYDRIALGPDEQELAASPWSDPVKVDSDNYFFMVKGSAQTQTARVEVWRVYDGRWHSEEFEVRPGDPIGQAVETTVSGGRELELDMNVGLIVVDLVQTSSGSFGGNDLRMLYLDPNDNRIIERSIEQDRNNPERIRLKNQQDLEAELALSPSNTGDVASRGY